MRKVLMGMIVVALAGCGSIPVDIETAPRAKASTVMEPAYLVAGADKGVVRIVRDGGIAGSALNAVIYVDGRYIASLDSNRVLELQVPAGAHRVGLQMMNVGEPIQYLDLDVVAGHTYDFRVSVTGNGWTADGHLDRLR
ncbi:hypothetical protein [Achromobacter ruhlandii]|jgi:uncharacterized protein YceK|uniref:DUF2846 domain-containing protein n=1 Tax=Achromobacter ruhlandii TaxID=72557 RepID=A0ABM8LX50_9BURK|nr:hypothetical protein [Achromobacter ruhlandii]AKP89464.1 hypothetical protein Axylo_1963 [Achromobacter xylosoxidans]AMG45715.1 hypothetical protein AL520_15745 [Achromobacter xylosoxidans]AOU92310.1 uncharacterized protein AruCF_1419 [Achromobacter ruhlandii]MCZ8431167.1 hypothetical protein [Achromobacter ruhlandii]MDC6087482.1 hypothetical protein [Achromobacter ruhlandii]